VAKEVNSSDTHRDNQGWEKAEIGHLPKKKIVAKTKGREMKTGVKTP